MNNDALLISDILSLPPAKKAEIAEHVDKLKKENGLYAKKKHRRPPAGSMPGLFKMAPDFDDPIPGFEDYM